MICDSEKVIGPIYCFLDNVSMIVVKAHSVVMRKPRSRTSHSGFEADLLRVLEEWRILSLAPITA